MTDRPHPHLLDRTVRIEAPIDLVFQYFIDSERWASWWGEGSTIDGRPGGHVLIRLPGGVEVTGEVVAIEPPSTVTFTYGYASGAPIPPGGSVVSIRLDADGDGTRLHLSHAFADEAARDGHVQGWRYQLSVFANVVANRTHADAASLIDRWLATWSNPAEAARARELSAIAAPDIEVHDRFTCVAGLEDLEPQLSAVHRFIPGLRLSRHGDVRHCQGTAIVDWQASSEDGQPRGRGTAVFQLTGNGRLRRVTMMWEKS